MAYIFIIFVLTPIIEITLFIKLGGYLGLITTISLVFLTAIVGVTILRLQGMATLLRAKTRLAQGQIPAQEMVEGLLLAVAGAFLLTPGFFTDTIGFTLLFPEVRRLVYGFFKGRAIFAGAQNVNAGAGEHTFEGEYRRDAKSGDSEDNLTLK